MHLDSKNYFSAVRPLAPPLSTMEGLGGSIDQLCFQLDDLHHDFQHPLKFTNLVMLIKANSVLYHTVEWQQLAVKQISLKCHILHINIT